MKIVAALACFLAVAPVAAGQEPVPSCDLLDRLVASAPGGFSDLRGERLQAGLFQSSLRVPGYACVVLSAADNNFLCYTPYFPTLVGKRLYATVDRQISSCFDRPEWARRPLIPADGDLIQIDGARYVRPVSGGEIVVGFGLSRKKEEAPCDALVSFGVLFIPAAQAGV